MSIENLSNIWPGWEIEKQIGKGSYGTVYQAVRRNDKLVSHAAIKVITIPLDNSELDSLRSEGLSADASRTYLKGVVDDFVNEIQLMESFKGIQNIVSVEDYEVVEKKDEIGWNIYIRMELLTPFNNYICDKTITEEDVIRLGTDICTALEICAKRNILHRDIKPENIFINDYGYFKLGDFGIARTMANMTSGLSQKGTPYYMAPEVFVSNKYDARADIYSLGIVMYKMLNQGRFPFLDTEKQLLDPAERINALERRKSGEPLTPPCDASKAMADVVLKACAFKADDRFANATELKKALESVKNGTYVATANVATNSAPQNAAKKADAAENTMAVKKAAAANQTVAVPNKNRVVSTTVQPKTNTFAPRDKKSGAKGAIIASVVILAALVIAGVFGYFYLEDRLASKPKRDRDDDEETVEITTTAALEAVTTEAVTVVTEDPSIAEIQSILDRAKSLEKDSKLADAIEVLEDGVADYPNSDELKTLLEECQTKFDEAEVKSILDMADVYMNSGNYQGAINTIMDGMNRYPESVALKEKLEECQKEQNTAEVTAIIEEANEYANNGYYDTAIEVINDGLAKYSDNATLKAKLDEYTAAKTAAEKQKVLDEAAYWADYEEYDTSISILEEALENAPDDEDFKAKLEEYTTVKQDKIINDALSEAQAFADDGDYINAIARINETIEVAGENEKLTEAVKTYEDTYASTVTVQIDKYLNENNVDAATELFDTAAKAFPENEKIAACSEKISSYSSETSVLLNTLTPINGGFKWNSGTPADPFESDYSNVKNYMIYHKGSGYYDSCDDSFTISAEYKIDGKYDVLKLNISPYSDYGQSASSYIMVYADNVLRYVSPKIYQKSGITGAEVDVSGATYLKIIVVKGKNGCIMLSDVTLEKVSGYISKQKTGYTSMATLKVFNGGFTYDSGYPTNVLGDSYMNVANYMIYHKGSGYYDYCSDSFTPYVEYYINSKYTSLSFDIAPYTDYGTNAVSRVKVYVDEELKYTSPDISQKTVKFNTGNIDLTGASYVKVVIEKGKYGCVILSDMLLKNAT